VTDVVVQALKHHQSDGETMVERPKFEINLDDFDAEPPSTA
jgi:hypothetical protein